tara:strand:+ start:3933 stop:4322 length:390 start_codon:yes stop_codon:yes gene_type:complete
MKRVFTNGCFDVIHRGHVELLKYCKSMGYVIVGLNSDISVKENKGQNRPFFPEEDRKFMLESLKYVDEVIVFDEKTPYELLSRIKPDLLVKGGDYKKEDIVGGNFCKDVKIFKYIDGYSTTSILKNGGI